MILETDLCCQFMQTCTGHKSWCLQYDYSDWYALLFYVMQLCSVTPDIVSLILVRCLHYQFMQCKHVLNVTWERKVWHSMYHFCQFLQWRPGIHTQYLYVMKLKFVSRIFGSLACCSYNALECYIEILSLHLLCINSYLDLSFHVLLQLLQSSNSTVPWNIAQIPITICLTCSSFVSISSIALTYVA
jgi:hypothetical protein